VAAINAAGGTQLGAEIVPGANGIRLTDKSGGGRTVTVTELNGSKAASDLGVLTPPGGIPGGIAEGAAIIGGMSTVLLSSHLLREVEVIADDIVMIGNGRIVSQGTKIELLTAGGSLVRTVEAHTLERALAAAGADTTRSGDGALRTTADPSLVGRVALAAGVALTELRTADGGLEEMFLELTADTQREGTAA